MQLLATVSTNLLLELSKVAYAEVLLFIMALTTVKS